MDEIDLFYLDYIDNIGGVENFTKEDNQIIKITFMCTYLEYRDKTINFFNN